MSIATEIARISKNVSDSFDAVETKGVTVPSGSTSDDLPSLILSIPAGSAISITDEQDSHGGTIRHINAVSLAGDTVSASVLLSGYTAHNSQGQAITGSYVPGASTLQTKTDIDPTESSQTIEPDEEYDGLASVQINAISSSYVGSGITRRDSTDLTESSGTVSVPSGYYASNASKAVSSGSAGTPTATKGTVSNHSISITPSVTNTTGYITGSTKTGTAVTVSASELVSGSETKTANGTYDVTNLASLVVNVSGGGGGVGTLINTTSLGALSTSSTSATNTNKTLSVTGYNDYDLLIVDISVDTKTNGRHTSTVSFIILTGTSNVTTKNTYTVAGNKWNSKLSSSGTASTRQSTSAYGVYANSASVSGSTMSIPIYYRYNSNSTGTLNGNYTARVYGLKLIDLIGG